MEDSEVEEAGHEHASLEPTNGPGWVISDAKRDYETEKERLQFEQMLQDHKKLLYPNCEDGLDSTLELLRWKAENSVIDSGFDKLLIMMKKLLPRDNKLSARPPVHMKQSSLSALLD
jgi:hypothetical protein